MKPPPLFCVADFESKRTLTHSLVPLFPILAEAATAWLSFLSLPLFPPLSNGHHSLFLTTFVRSRCEQVGGKAGGQLSFCVLPGAHVPSCE